ncbi:MAG: hypothetical protein ACK5LO_06220 [Leucobacter sp.]
MSPASASAQLARPLPSPPRIDHWPRAVRSAEMLRGTLVRCGPGLRLVGWPETPRVRAHALAPWYGTGHNAAIRMTAAWIWGAARSPGHPLEFSTTRGRRAESTPGSEHALHQFSYESDEIHSLGEFQLTTPLRTVADVLRIPGEFSRAHRVACRLLVQLIPGGTDAVRDRLTTVGPAYRAAAVSRLRQL